GREGGREARGAREAAPAIAPTGAGPGSGAGPRNGKGRVRQGSRGTVQAGAADERGRSLRGAGRAAAETDGEPRSADGEAEPRAQGDRAGPPQGGHEFGSGQEAGDGSRGAQESPRRDAEHEPRAERAAHAA